jgi:hypothetical protein
MSKRAFLWFVVVAAIVTSMITASVTFVAYAKSEGLQAIRIIASAGEYYTSQAQNETIRAEPVQSQLDQAVKQPTTKYILPTAATTAHGPIACSDESNTQPLTKLVVRTLARPSRNDGPHTMEHYSSGRPG